MGKYKNLLLNIGLFTLNTVSTKLITFLLVPLYTYFLTTQEYGITDMALTLINLVFPVVTCSITDAVVRYLIDDDSHTGRYITIGFWTTVLGCIIMALFSPVFDLPMFGGLGAYKWFYIANFTMWSFNSFLSNVARGLNQIKLITGVSIVTALTTGGAAGILIGIVHLKVPGYFISVTLGSTIGVILYLLCGRHYRYISLPRRHEDKVLLKRMLMFSLPMIPNAVFWWIGMSVNRFFITSMLGIGASGLFAAANKIPNIMNLLSTTFWQAWSLSAFQEFRKSNIAGFFSTVFSVFKALVSAVASLVILLAPWIASFMLQKSFYGAWTLIPLQIFALYFNVLAGFYGTVFTSSMKTKYLMTTTAVAATLVIVLNWLLIPRFGLQGSAVALAISNAVMLTMRILESRSIIKVEVNWVPSIAVVLLLGVQSAVMALQVPRYLLWSSGLFVLILIVEAIDILPSARLLLSKLQAAKRRKAMH